MVTRADSITAKSLTPTRYSDLDVALSLNPVTGLTSRVVDDVAVAQAIRFTILTNREEWPFEPDNGSDVTRSLFDPSDKLGLDVIRDSIAAAVRNRCSGYAQLVGVQVTARRDARSVDVLVAYKTRGSDSVGTVSTVLRLVRR